MNTKSNTIGTRGNTKKAVAFSISADAKMFLMLSSGLYSNKIRAVIREIYCNANDANVMNNTSHIPIKVHLPNYDEPYFSVKDSGLALTPISMEKVYTRYGSSTKEDNNSQTGAFGLGSKSPFAYTDSFSICSIRDGVTSEYNCYIDSTREPKLIQVSSNKTGTKSSSLEVRFDVVSKDFDSFISEAEEIFRPFKTKPKISGNVSYQELYYDIKLKSISKRNYWELLGPRNKENSLIQGNIEYPIKTSIIKPLLTPEEATFLDSNFNLYFNIGDLEVQVSREEIGYDSKTIDNIVQKIKQTYKEIKDVLQSRIDNCSTLYMARQELYECIKYKNISFSSFMYNNKIINTSFDSMISWELVEYKYIQGSVKTSEYMSYNRFNIPRKHENIKYIFNDTTKKGVQEARLLARQGYVVYVFSDLDFIKTIGNPSYINLSTLSTTKKVSTNKGAFFKSIYLGTYNMHRIDKFKSSLEIGLDLTSQFYYTNEHLYDEELSSLIRVSIKLGIIKRDIKIYEVKSTHRRTKKFSNYNTICIEEYLVQEIKNNHITKYKEILEYGLNIKNKEDKYNDLSYCIRSLIESPNTILNKNSDFRKVQEELKPDDRSNNLYKQEDIEYTMDIKNLIGLDSSDFNIEEINLPNIEQIYPLLSIGSYYKSNLQYYIKYIEDMDELIRYRRMKEKYKELKT